MTMHVIHILEIVQIEHQQRHAFMFTRGALKQRNTCFGNGTAVEKTCQRIGRRQKTCALLGLLALLYFYLKVAVTSPAKENKRDVKQQRSEEHTSDLQSLMRISYAVFCF